MTILTSLFVLFCGILLGYAIGLLSSANMFKNDKLDDPDLNS